MKTTHCSSQKGMAYAVENIATSILALAHFLLLSLFLFSIGKKRRKGIKDNVIKIVYMYHLSSILIAGVDESCIISFHNR